MRLIILKTGNNFQFFHHIVNNRAHRIMYQCTKKPPFEIFPMQMRKFPAFGKPVFILSTLIILEKMTGHRFHNLLTTDTFFQEFAFKFFGPHLNTIRHPKGITIRYIDH